MTLDEEGENNMPVYTTPSRRPRIIINYEGKDISSDIAPYLLSFTFTDNSGGKADDIAITLEDREGLWLNDWQPSKSDVITCSIVKEDFPETLTLPCGTFSIDQIDYSYPPAVLSIKAVSASVKKGIAQEKHTHFWENMTLAGIASEIAARNGLALMMSTGGTGALECIDQTEETDLEFLLRVCRDYGQECKIQEGRIVIYDLEEYEERASVLTISITDKRLLSIKFASKSAKVYRKAVVKHHDSVKDEDYEGEYEDDDEEGSERELVIYERVESQGEAERIARERLKDANRKEITGTLTMTGDVMLSASQTVELEDMGMFSGKHFITKATHKVDRGGYTTTLELGMPSKSKKAVKKAKSSRRKSGGGNTELYYDGPDLY